MGSFSRSIGKWLIITLVVVIVLFTILLGLGLLLNENEKATQAYLTQKVHVKVELPSVEQRVEQTVELPDQLTVIKNIIVEHNTCRNDQQCAVINTGVIELGCFVPVNSIGASLLRNTLTQNALMQDASSQETDENCLAKQNESQVSVSCQTNICTLNKVF